MISIRDLSTLESVVPQGVHTICETLQSKGFAAYAVGGAVRDALLGRPIGDWDIATDARPKQVMECFSRTIPTGLQHGTITVLVGKGPERMNVEVTTFRGEGAYSDGRRPDEIHFGVSFEEDLSRRDFVINAIAYDPIARVLRDPLGGIDDLRAGTIRAVGDARLRFQEDGLRVMRAVRFAATLQFQLEESTYSAIPHALSSLAKVSKERVRDELTKMMGAVTPSLGLACAIETGALSVGLGIEFDPQLAGFRSVFGVIDAAQSAAVRIALLLANLDTSSQVDIDSLLRTLKFSNATRTLIVRLVCFADRCDNLDDSDASVRRVLAEIGRVDSVCLLELWEAQSRVLGDMQRGAIAARARAILGRGDPLAVGDLLIDGTDVMTILQTKPGRQIGEILHQVLDQVLETPTLNTKAALTELVKQLAA